MQTMFVSDRPSVFLTSSLLKSLVLVAVIVNPCCRKIVQTNVCSVNVF